MLKFVRDLIKRQIVGHLTENKVENAVIIPLSANGWITKCDDNSHEVITSYGLGNWMSSESVISVYFYSTKSGIIDVSINCKVPKAKSRLKLSLDKISYKIDVYGNQYTDHNVGQFLIENNGYVKLDMQGLTKTGGYYADVSHINLSGHGFDSESISFIPIDDEEVSVYFGRRGPFVHLFYEIPNEIKCKYYYCELMVPKGFDTIGSYFMAIGFNEGYFGIQVNDENERRILFSVWSPQQTEDRNEVTDDNRVIEKHRGHQVVINQFEGEGCGGQSFIRYNWTTDTVYKFLIRGMPGKNHTTYIAWFAEINSDWKLIAGFNRQKTCVHLSGFYSFLENFIPETGYLSRKCFYNNQWVCDITGQWHEVTKAKLNGDSTATNKIRRDFSGGVEHSNEINQQFYLQNCGFFEGKVNLLTNLLRTENKICPEIDFEKLLII